MKKKDLLTVGAANAVPNREKRQHVRRPFMFAGISNIDKSKVLYLRRI